MFEGTVICCNGETVSEVLGTRAEFQANGSWVEESEHNNWYALLELDAAQDVYVEGHSMHPVTKTFVHIKLGEKSA